MSRWSDPQEWAALVNGASCPICRAGVPLDVVAELEVSWVTMSEDAALPGYCCLVFRRHAVELHHLTAEEAGAYMRDIQRLSRAIESATGSVKLNYEIHGNTIPHLHVHFFPRYVGDPFEGGPIDPLTVTGAIYRAGEFEEMKARLLTNLDEDPVV